MLVGGREIVLHVALPRIIPVSILRERSGKEEHQVLKLLRRAQFKINGERLDSTADRHGI